MIDKTDIVTHMLATIEPYIRETVAIAARDAIDAERDRLIEKAFGLTRLVTDWRYKAELAQAERDALAEKLTALGYAE
jgi:hypothetical protein